MKMGCGIIGGVGSLLQELDLVCNHGVNLDTINCAAVRGWETIYYVEDEYIWCEYYIMLMNDKWPLRATWLGGFIPNINTESWLVSLIVDVKLMVCVQITVFNFTSEVNEAVVLRVVFRNGDMTVCLLIMMCIHCSSTSVTMLVMV